MIYLIKVTVKGHKEQTLGYATTKEKAEKMIEKLKSEFGNDLKVGYIPAETDLLFVNGKEEKF